MFDLVTVYSRQMMEKQEQQRKRFMHTVNMDIEEFIKNEGEFSRLDAESESMRTGCFQEFLFFIKHSIRDILRRKCHFCLAFCSVFVVVLSTLVVNTVIAKGPIIFLSLN